MVAVGIGQIPTSTIISIWALAALSIPEVLLSLALMCGYYSERLQT